MNPLRPIIVGLLAYGITSCTISVRNTKFFPDFKGIDPLLSNNVSEYIALANSHNIKLRNNITVGFTNIKIKNVIGETYFGTYFREISIDYNYWVQSTPLSRKILLFHELTHGYCNRDHDYGIGEPYPSVDHTSLLNGSSLSFYGKGMYDDSCPMSIMYPYIVNDKCSEDHYNDYIEEMFDRCNPYL